MKCKKIFAMILALCMVLSTFVSVSAAAEKVWDDGNIVTIVDVEKDFDSADDDMLNGTGMPDAGFVADPTGEREGTVYGGACDGSTTGYFGFEVFDTDGYKLTGLAEGQRVSVTVDLYTTEEIEIKGGHYMDSVSVIDLRASTSSVTPWPPSGKWYQMIPDTTVIPAGEWTTLEYELDIDTTISGTAMFFQIRPGIAADVYIDNLKLTVIGGVEKYVDMNMTMDDASTGLLKGSEVTSVTYADSIATAVIDGTGNNAMVGVKLVNSAGITQSIKEGDVVKWSVKLNPSVSFTPASGGTKGILMRNGGSTYPPTSTPFCQIAPTTTIPANEWTTLEGVWTCTADYQTPYLNIRPETRMILLIDEITVLVEETVEIREPGWVDPDYSVPSTVSSYYSWIDTITGGFQINISEVAGNVSSGARSSSSYIKITPVTPIAKDGDYRVTFDLETDNLAYNTSGDLYANNWTLNMRCLDNSAGNFTNSYTVGYVLNNAVPVNQGKVRMTYNLSDMVANGGTSTSDTIAQILFQMRLDSACNAYSSTGEEATIKVTNIKLEAIPEDELTEKVATPTASVPSGIVSVGDGVFLNCETAGAIIYYTEDGSDPTDTTNRSRYSYNDMDVIEPIYLYRDTVLKVYAEKEGMLDSDVAEYTYEIFDGVSEVSSGLGTGGEFPAGVGVALYCDEEDVIYYTLDGTDPIENGILYQGEIRLMEDTTIKAVAYSEHYDAYSSVSVFTYTVILTPEPTVSVDPGEVESGTTVELLCGLNYVTIYYTVDGTDPKVNGILYNQPISITADTTIKAVAVSELMAYSETVEFTYTVMEEPDPEPMETVATPTANLPSGTMVEYGTNLEMACETEGATIYYTLDGSIPTTDSNRYSHPIFMGESQVNQVTFKIIAVKDGMTNSEVAEYTYTIHQTDIDVVTANIASGTTVAKGTNIELSYGVGGEKIYYTLDGTNPVINGILYEEPICINEDTTITAVVDGGSLGFSVVVEFTYTVESDPEPDPETAATIVLGSARGRAGDVVEVPIEIKNNPGIISMDLELSYDKQYIELIEVVDEGKLGTALFSDKLTSVPYKMNWNDDTASENMTYSGVIATIKFKIKDNAPVGTYEIKVEHDEDYGIYDYDLNPVAFNVENTEITVRDFIFGDVNNDESVTSMDRTILARYLTGWDGYESKVDFDASDLNGDGKVTSMDRTILARHLTSWDGYETLPKL